jgi:CheY-like chemotaxis protein
LATVYGIVKQNNGCIYAYSELGEGTTFKIFWPNSEDELALEEGEDLTKEISTGTETIVLVEDDKAVRDFAGAALKDLGYTVFEAVNGKDALELIDKKLNGNNSNINVDLIITDMVMPEMNGRELAAQMEKICPESKVIFASGYTDNQIVKSGSLKEGINFIQKPFSINVLAEKVRSVLDSN